MKSVELFVGAGGLAIGTAGAGFQHVAAIEWDHDACETIRENQRKGVKEVADWDLFEGDVRKYDYSAIHGGVDMVCGGPPCQPFSLGGKHQGRQDNRDMFPEAVRAVRELKPRAFMFENVRGLLRPVFRNYFQYVCLQLAHPTVVRKSRETWMDHHARLERKESAGDESSLSYRVLYRVLNAADFGVPQRRERVFIVGFRSDLGIDWSFPEPTHSSDSLFHSKWATGEYWERHYVPKKRRPELSESLLVKAKLMSLSDVLPFPTARLEPWRTVRDALVGLPEPTVGGRNSEFSNHRLQLGARQYPGHTGSVIDEPAKTLKAGGHGVPGGENMLALPDGMVRYFTVRESARLQTFPDDYVFRGSWTESMRQLGNAVPVNLARVVAESVATRLTASNQARSRN